MTSNSFLNQFKQQNSKGVIDLRYAPNELMQVIFNKDSVASDPIVVGDVIKLVTTGASPLPIIDEVTVNTGASFGVVAYQMKKNSYTPGDIIGIASSTGTVVYMEANASINRGEAVQWEVASKQVAPQTGGSRIGYALDYASAQGELVRIQLDFEKA